jgi:CheY-like chemotaxis protein
MVSLNDEPPEGGATPAPGPRFQVCVAEDNPTNAMLAEIVLSTIGCEVTGVSNGRDAVRAVKSRRVPFDAVFMDAKMPELDGMAAAREIRAWERDTGARHTLIIALTASHYDEDLQACLLSGMDDVLTKPFLIDRARDMLAKWLPGR